MKFLIIDNSLTRGPANYVAGAGSRTGEAQQGCNFRFNLINLHLHPEGTASLKPEPAVNSGA